MIQIQNMHLAFGEQVIFDNVSLHIKRLERIGLVGPNGAGKTTLMRIILREVVPDKGQLKLAKQLTFGYLPQQQVESRGKLLLDEVLSGVEEVKRIEAEIKQLQEGLSEPSHSQSDTEKNLKRLGELQHRFEELGGFHLEHEARRILGGLGFSEDQFGQPCETFSGGWQMRIALAKLLLRRPSALLLDEPTNHLDITSMEWLESFLYKYPGIIILVSHDRFFLDRVVNKIISLERGKLSEFSGSYTFFETERQRQEEQIMLQYERQKQEIERIQRFIERFRYKASKAPQVQSRIKQLEKMEKIIPPSSRKKIRFSFPAAVRSGRIVFKLRELGKYYGAKHVFENVNITIERGERVALVGVNGAGKSTLSRILAGTENATTGEIEFGHQVKLAFYAQETANTLNGEQTILDDLSELAPQMDMSRLRTLLGCFLFEGDDAFKSVSVLSGGEKSRLALAKMLLRESNVLILDEPTNHLDIAGKDVLQEALQEYQGTLILVSHDRYFLDKIVNRVIALDNGLVNEYLGNYSYYLSKREEDAPAEEEEKDQPAKSHSSKKSKEQKRLEAETRQASYQQRREVEKARKAIETEIETKEARKAEIESELTQPAVYTNPALSKELNTEYRRLLEVLPELYAKWEHITESSPA
ncbi:ABC-F family ATP-binding cassette domain-containing protein [candidate division KSB1 bacterium]|nr:ABC-F family ATP-binding cassette domain-containing protein [candidate division KSB1 bacterium]